MTKPAKPKSPSGDFLAQTLASAVQQAYGPDQANTYGEDVELGAPRGYISTRNVALERALGRPGFPLGRIIEISAWEGAGKSTLCDEVMAECQAQGGLAVLADTERARERANMEALGVQFDSLVRLGATTVESLFGEVELVVRRLKHANAMAWYEALKFAKVKVAKPTMTNFEVYDGVSSGSSRPVAKFKFAKWGREQQAALMEYQKGQGLPMTGTRDAATRLALRPAIVAEASEAERKEALAEHFAGNSHPLAQEADRPVVIVWDSVGGTPAHAELEGSSHDTNPAAAARVIKRNMRRLTQLIDDESILFLLANQRYTQIGQGTGFRGYVPSESYGGSGIRFHSSIRIELTKKKEIPPIGVSSDDAWKHPPMGQEVAIKVIKSRMGSPQRRAKYALIYGRGCENAWALFHDLKDRGIIAQGGPWSRFTDPEILDDKAWNGGWAGLSNLIAENPGLYDKLVAKYMETT